MEVKTLKKVLKWLDDNIEVYICVALMSVMAVLIFVQVIARYVFGSSLSWSEELARYIFIWLIYIGISYGCKLRKHIKIEAALKLFPKKVRPYVTILGDILFFAFCLYIIFTGYRYCGTTADLGKYSPALKIPFQYVYLSIPVGFTLAAVRQIQCIVYRIKCIKNGEEVD